MKLILELTQGLSSGDKFLHYIHVLFISSLEPEAVMDHESLVCWRDKLLIDVSNTTNLIGGVLEGKSGLRIQRVTWSSHSQHLRRQTLYESTKIYRHLTRTR